MFKDFFPFKSWHPYAYAFIVIIGGVIVLNIGQSCQIKEPSKRYEHTTCTKECCFIWNEQLARCGLRNALAEEKMARNITDKNDSVIALLNERIKEKDSLIKIFEDRLNQKENEIHIKENREKKSKEELKKIKEQLSLCNKIKKDSIK